MKVLNRFYQSFGRPFLDRFGVELVRTHRFPPDFEEIHREICDLVEPYTMTSRERLFSLIEAVTYVSRHKIEGDFVECGVWKGGSAMAMAATLARVGDTQRQLHLYDTFAGMSEPTELDRSISGHAATAKYDSTIVGDGVSSWCLSAIEEVRENLSKVNYPSSQIHLIQGKVEDTVPLHIPTKIALLRLDTDWYESTKHELEHLFPLLSTNGVLIVDDYDHWQGVRKAVDEYFGPGSRPILLNRVDYTGRIGIKVS